MANPVLKNNREKPNNHIEPVTKFQKLTQHLHKQVTEYNS
jgi:hypothetical protein